MKQQAFGTWSNFKIEPETRDGADGADDDEEAPEAAGWSEEDIEYLADTALTVPGRGDRPEDCGDYLPLKYCPTCGEPHALERTCGGRRCPSCSTVWMGEHAEKGTVRVAAAREAAGDGWKKRVVHAGFSPPAGEMKTIVDYQRGKKKAQRLAKEHGIRGGAVIGHAYRVTDEAKAEFRRLKEAGEVECGLWRWILDERPGSWREAVYFSPHYHIIGFVEDFAPSSPADDDGWIAKNIRPVEEHNLTKQKPYDDLYGLFYYLLSHASFDPENSQHAIRWFGNVAYNKFSPEHLPEWKESVVRRLARAARDEKLPDEYEHTCDEEGCHAALAPITEAKDHLQNPGWCDSIGRETQRRLLTAVDWFYGNVIPPPGKRHPRSEAAADDLLDELVADR